MDYKFSELKKKTVIDVASGAKIGKITDLTVSYPSCCLVSFTVSPPFCLTSAEKKVLSPCDIEKIGEDTVLVRKKSNQPNFCEEDE